MSLPIDDRTLLAQRLWQSVEGFIEPSIGEEWIEVANRRWKEIENEKVKCKR
ncbi:MAG: addiction module protein [bacterium]|nr:addiction module protein [bacterium]